MTIREYLNKSKETGLDDVVQDMAEVWSNAAATGYAIKAMLAAGTDHGMIDRVVKNLQALYEEMPIEKAERTYYDY